MTILKSKSKKKVMLDHSEKSGYSQNTATIIGLMHNSGLLTMHDESDASHRSEVKRLGKNIMTDTDESSFSDPSQSLTDFSSRFGSTRDEEELGIANRETKAVNRSRACMILVLLVFGSVLGGVSYMVGRKSEEKACFVQFDNLASEVITMSQAKVMRVFDVLGSLSLTITSTALHGGAENVGYPAGFLTLPDVEQHFGMARNVSQALVMAYLPLVQDPDRATWQNYSVQHQDWILKAHGANVTVQEEALDPIADQLWGYPPKNKTRRGLLVEGGDCEDEGTSDGRRLKKNPIVAPEGSAPYAPVWLVSPPPAINDTFIVNYNMFNKPVFERAVSFIQYTRKPAFLDVCTQTKWFGAGEGGDDPQTVVVQPVFQDFTENSPIVGHMAAVITWNTFFEEILANEEADSVDVVMSNTCDEEFSYKIQGPKAQFMGEIDMHEDAHDTHMHSSIFADFANPEELLEAGVGDHCVYTIQVYMRNDMMVAYSTDQPIWYVAVVISIFVFTAIVFIVYDKLVGHRQAVVMSSAVKTHALVASLFPTSVKDRILNQKEEAPGKKSYASDAKGMLSNHSKHSSYLPSQQGAPIADLFPETTIMFADIVGFTSWSSMRQPTEVFMLLETLYAEFDRIAKRRRVFKVETIGDCYVAVCGLPNPVDDHPVVMSRFASECLLKMQSVTKDLERTLGVGTADLGLRTGLHSGPVTAGVLRGERARFQLFGDTMNTASRMESTGMKNMIQVSQETAYRLMAAGKSKWLEQREDQVEAKGKGLLSTYFLVSGKDEHTSVACNDPTCNESECKSSDPASSPSDDIRDTIKARFVEYNTDLLTRTLHMCLVQRKAAGIKPSSMDKMKRVELATCGSIATVLDQFQEVIDLSNGRPAPVVGQSELPSAELSREVQEQLAQYVAAIANVYLDNPFHNFEHASHVTMSVNKLMSRIVAHHLNNTSASEETTSRSPESIFADPLVQFATLLSALMHDVEHPGVPNSQLVKEGKELALAYDNTSVAEQNSVDVAFSMLMTDAYTDLRRAIYTNEREFTLFRSVIVNAVMATDIVNKELGELRKARWNKAFSCEGIIEEGLSNDRKATIVLEHLIQASDIAHTMQHWTIYRKWNARLFAEMYKAYMEGRSDNNPADGWYEGEIGFFDFYIIPLAKKLKDLSIFGVSSDEYLSYAERNRDEWKRRGAEVVAELVAKAEEDWGNSPQLLHQSTSQENEWVFNNSVEC